MPNLSEIGRLPDPAITAPSPFATCPPEQPSMAIANLCFRIPSWKGIASPSE